MALAEDTEQGFEADGTILVEDTNTQTTSSSKIEIDDTISVTDTLANILQRQSSVFIRDMGGMGTSTTLSIRGTSARQNLMILNGIPLNPDGVSSINLSDIPVQMLETVTLYRSHAPLLMMSNAMGGVVDMQTQDSPTPMLRSTVDSWTNLQVQGHTPFTNTFGYGNLFISGLQAPNAYPYFDNRNTPFNDTDDQWKTRVNNDVQTLQGLATWTMNGLDVLHAELYREQGIPGHITIPTPDIRLGSRRRLTGIHNTESTEHWSHDSVAWWSTQSETLADPLGNLGQGALEQAWTFQMIGGRSTHRWTGHETFFPSVGLALRRDYATSNSPSEHTRYAGQGQVGNELILDTIQWNWSLQGHWLSSQDTLSWVPKTSVLWNATDRDHMWIAIVRGFRPPDFTELYGNRGAIIGNVNLLPETGTTLDVGWTHSNVDHWLKRLQLGTYWRESQNEILFVQNAQRQSLPINFEATRVIGLESEWEIGIQDRILWTGSLSLTDSTNLSQAAGLTGNTLPNVPRWMSGQQLWWMTEHFWLGTDVYWSDGNFWDAPNQRRAPTRLMHNATLRYTKQAWELELNGRNLWNRITVDTPIDPLNPDLGLYPEAVQDFLGYPLMGRSVSLSVTWSPSTQPTR